MSEQQIHCPVHQQTKCDCTTEYRLYSAIMDLPSYGLIAGERDNPMVSRKDILKLLERKSARA